MVHPFLDDDRPLAFAHRGGDIGGGRENTLAAFQDAVDLGYRYLETDLHATADGVLVAFHDATLDRVTDRRGPIAQLSYAEVARARIAGSDPIPRFEELLASFPDVRWNLDVKADAAVGPLLARLRGDDDLLARTCVGSFSDERLGHIRVVLGERVCTSAGPAEVRKLRAASVVGPLAGGVRLAANALQVPLRARGLPVVDRAFLAAARRRGLPVHVWTINEPRTMERLLDLGVQGLITDATRALRDVLHRRGHWREGHTHDDGAVER
jgi:glycerophosphoryl diester phosphodiesterase